MRRVLLIVQVLMFSMLVSAQEGRTQLQLHSFAECTSQNIIEKINALLDKGWPKDANGEKECALVRVTFEDLTDNDASDVAFYFGSTAPKAAVKNRLKEKEPEVWVFVTPSDKAIIEASLTKYGKSNRLPNVNLEPRHVYDVVLKNNKRLTLNVVTNPENITASLETGQSAVTPATITNVTMGRHTLKLSKDGKLLHSEDIEVNEENVRFEYDLRKKRTIRFVTSPSNAMIYINGKEAGRSPLEVDLPYESYKINAVLSDKEKDERMITVSDNSPEEIALEPVMKRRFYAVASFEGRSVPATLYVDGECKGMSKESYDLTLPVGKTYEMEMSYGGFSTKRSIKITNDMERDQIFYIKQRKYVVWPWQRDYDVAPMGFSIGYVAKQLVAERDGDKIKTNGVFGQEDKFLQGLQVGVHFQPCLSFGLGVYTGLFYEFYYAKNSGYVEDTYNKFMEHCLYVPVHAFYRIPFANKVALSLHFGPGFSYVVSGAYVSNAYRDDKTGFYGKDGHAEKFNMTFDMGLGMRVGDFQLNAQYNMGLNNHKKFKHDYTTKQNKISVTVSYLFSGGY